MPAKPLVLPSRKFASGSEAKAFCRRIHNERYRPGDVVRDAQEVAVLQDLVARHPRADEKVGPGIREFFIQYTSYGDRKHVSRGQTGIWIRDVDGAERDFSYNTAIDQPTAAATVKDALRNEILDLRESLREAAFDGGPVTCPITGLVFDDWREAAVVYRDPTWADLTLDFANLVGGWDLIDTRAGDGGIQIGRLLRDPKLVASWREHWIANANPLVVSKAAIA